MQVKCSECGHMIEMDVQERPAKDVDTVEVGFECPDCHTWFHGYFDTPELKAQRNLLAKFKAKAARSQADFQRYKRKQQAFKEAFYRINAETPAQVDLALI